MFYRDSQGTEKRYYLAVLTRGTGEYEARDAIQSMALAVHEALTDAGGDRRKPEFTSPEKEDQDNRHRKP